ncbi:OLC1v1024837C1 [Oldenlandia corymbosa var. corymbosa]|uniref:OLC1v1024837C1 n=1 Tax=Oldenlandia corymbosa var. corymbosa TaxID=529605 RepID=A0AAV1C5H5_OLDCO|nr:OLC1v1024837C1 [Oldenlandia corymbosa var. corymbosa]
MASSSLLTCLQSALLDTDLLLKHSASGKDRETCELLKVMLRNLKAFVVLCAGVFDADTNKTLWRSSLRPFEDMVRRNEANIHPLCLNLSGNDAETERKAFGLASHFQSQIQYSMGELKQCLVPLSDFSSRRSTSLTPNEFCEIICCVLENMHYCISLMPLYWGDIVRSRVESSAKGLEEQTTFLNCLLCFSPEATQDMLAHTVVDVAFDAASLVFKYGQVLRADEETRESLTYEMLTDVQGMKNRQHQLHETYYALTLSCSKFPRQPLAPTQEGIDVNNEAFGLIKSVLDYLIPILWKILGANTGWAISMKDQLQGLLRALRSLRETLLKQRHCSSNSNIKKDIGAVVCDAGVLIYLLYGTSTEVDLEILQDLLESIETILAEVENNQK